MNKEITTHREVDKTDPIEAKKNLWQKIGTFLGVLHDYSAKDIGRIREAAVKQIEMKAAVLQADAHAKMAEAEERNAKADQLRAEAERTRAEAAKIQADVISSVVEAINKIEAQGGKVDIDEAKLLQFLGRVPKDGAK